MSAIEPVGDRLPSTLAEREAIIERGLASFLDVGSALIAIKRDRQYREAGYPTFEDYCNQRWSMSRQQGYRLVAAAATAASLAEALPEMSPTGDIPAPTNEAQVRPLAALEPEQAAEAWTQAVEDAGGEQPTAEQVKAAAVKVTVRESKSTTTEGVNPVTGEIVGAGVEGKPAPDPRASSNFGDSEVGQEWEDEVHPPRPEPQTEPSLSLAEQRARDWEEAKARHARQLQRLISLWPYIDDWADHSDDYRADVLAHLTDHDRMLLARIEARITGQHVFPLDKEAA